MKKIKKILSALIALALLISVFMLTACDSNYVLVDLKTGYEQGLINYDDLLNIAYYRQGTNFNVDKFDENFTPKEKGELSTFTKHQINKTFAKYGNYSYTIFDFSQYDFIYYGEYAGYIAFSRVNTSSYPGLTIDIIYLDDIKFSIPDGGGIYLWKKL